MARSTARTDARTTARPDSLRRRLDGGMTLVELLIVMGIIVLLMAASIKLAQPAFQGRKVREAARQLNAFFAGAKARASERGRPFGVWFKRTPGNLNECVEVYQAEIPPPYVGDLLEARVGFRLDTVNPMDPFYRLVFDTAQCGQLFSAYQPLVGPGETFWIKFDFRGQVQTAIRLAPNDADTSDDFRLLGSPPAVGAAPHDRVKFQIYLQPRQSLVTPLDLPNGTAIDLSWSGLGALGTQFDAWNAPPAMGATPPPDTNPVILLFSPGGSVELVYSRGGSSSPVSEIHFLVGRNDTIAALDVSNPVGPPNPRAAANLQDQESLWVTVGHRTGAVTTAENYYSSLAPTLDVSRQFARTAVSKGGG